MLILQGLAAATLLAQLACGADLLPENHHPDLTAPPLEAAVATMDRDLAPGGEGDPRGQRVPLPAGVRLRLEDAVLERFLERRYEGVTRYRDLFGPVSRSEIPGRSGLALFALAVSEIPGGRGESLALVLHDPATGRVNSRAAMVPAPLPDSSLLRRPFLRFEDLDGDGRSELSLPEVVHRGSELTWVVRHHFHPEDDLRLRPVLRLEEVTALGPPGRTQAGAPFLVRTIERAGARRIVVRATASSDPLRPGEREVGRAVLECARPGAPFLPVEQSSGVPGFERLLLSSEGGEAEALTARGQAMRRGGPFGALEDDALLDLLERRAFLFFTENQDPVTGLVLDRAPNFEGRGERTAVASTAATGYGLAALAVGERRGWIDGEEARGRILRTLRFARRPEMGEHGFLYHFVDRSSGQRVWESEVSSIDTALFLAGAILASRRFPESEVEREVDALLRAVDYPWMLTDGGARPESLTLSMGFRPGKGFIESRWDHYCELIVLEVLALGAPERPAPAAAWGAWKRLEGRSGGTSVGGAILPLFVHQYSHLYLDLGGLEDGLFDYQRNSLLATHLNRAFCRERAGRFKTFGEGFWGLSASDGPRGYRAYAPVDEDCDGTVCPAAALASLVFAEGVILDDLRRWSRHAVWPRLWGRYGLADAFNLDRDWVSPDCLGITVGALLLAIEDLRTGWVWKEFAAHPAIRRGLERAGFRPGGTRP
jgi:hypothetical protein